MKKLKIREYKTGKKIGVKYVYVNGLRLLVSDSDRGIHTIYGIKIYNCGTIDTGDRRPILAKNSSVTPGRPDVGVDCDNWGVFDLI